MCLAVPGEIEALDGASAQVRVLGALVRARLDLLEGAQVGDWVLVHAGFAIAQLDATEARETLDLLEEARGLHAE